MDYLITAGWIVVSIIATTAMFLLIAALVNGNLSRDNEGVCFVIFSAFVAGVYYLIRGITGL